MARKAKTRNVTLATDWVTDDGKAHKGGDDVALPASEARNLVFRGKARFTEDVKKDSGGEKRENNSALTNGTVEAKK